MESFSPRQYLDAISERLLHPGFFTCWGDWFWMHALGRFFQMMDFPEDQLNEVQVRDALHAATYEEIQIVLEASSPFPMRDDVGVLTPRRIKELVVSLDYVRDELVICLRMVVLQLLKKPSRVDRDSADWWKGTGDFS